MSATAYELIDGDLHRHGTRTHAHSHRGPHTHDDAHEQDHDHVRVERRDRRARDHTHDHGGHGHSHGLIDDSIKRSREGVRAVVVSLAVLGATAILQALIFVLSGSVALLADLIHNFGDALTAVPLGAAFLLRSERAERNAGLFVVAAIFISACVAGVEAVQRLIDPNPPDHLLALAGAGVIGYLGNWIAARVRTSAGERLHSAALSADGHHARADALVSLAVVGSAVVVAIGVPVADPIIGLVITLVILRITWQSWATIRGHEHQH
jgi:divalent metal cation (Fe/Co/Zn/Cd) transporter